MRRNPKSPLQHDKSTSARGHNSSAYTESNFPPASLLRPVDCIYASNVLETCKGRKKIHSYCLEIEGTIGQQVNSRLLFIPLYSRVFFTPLGNASFVVSIPTPYKSPVESLPLSPSTRFLGFRRGVHPKEYTACVQEHVTGNVHTPANQNFSWKIDCGAIIAALVRKGSHTGRHSPPPSLDLECFQNSCNHEELQGSRRQIPIRASAPMATGEYREEQPNGYYFDEPCECGKLSQCYQEDSPLLS